jgi:hypothetical protein
MSYYLLPKHNNIINIEMGFETNIIKPYTSFSLYNYYNKLMKENTFLFDKVEDSVHLIHPYQYIVNPVPSLKLPISKISNVSTIFYDLLDIIYVLNFKDVFSFKYNHSLHISTNFHSSIHCFQFLSENTRNSNIGFNKLSDVFENDLYFCKKKEFDWIFIEIPNVEFEMINYSIITLLNFLKLIFTSQSNNGCCIIKINNLFYKPLIDFIYILCSLYEKVYIIKPQTSNIIGNEKYIVCKGFILNDSKTILYTHYYNILVSIIDTLNKQTYIKNISYIIPIDLPLYFINKIDDINIIIGQQLLETINLCVNIIKNKNRELKLENIKKMNIQKCILWCEKMGIPCNKNMEKPNIFLKNTESFNEYI